MMTNDKFVLYQHDALTSFQVTDLWSFGGSAVDAGGLQP